MLKIIFRKSFEKSLLKFSHIERKRILKKISDLSEEKENLDIKKLHPKDKNWYRLRIGRYRVIFKYETKRVILFEVDSRDRIYFYVS
ncbi:type II toxin-antitoxin system RelE/ParE family toxin [Candidatus Gracilibacteria bacterium]|nr:type II toxin-antitoxin system RelE/ParE family toxin [Candidatus Gracilibacteria bacterium]